MFAAFLAFVLRQRLLVLGTALAVVAGGVFGWRALPIDAFPDVSPAQVKVIVKVPGMTPEEVEQRVATPIELELLGLPRKRVVRSVSKYGLTDVTVDFEDGTDIWWARQQVSERIAPVMRELPAGAGGGLAPVTTPLGEMLMFTLEGDGFTLADKRRVLDWTIRPALRSVPGVAELNSLGGEVRTYEVAPDAARMNAAGVTFDALAAALSANVRNDGAGRVDRGEETLAVRVEASVRDPADLGAIVVGESHGRAVRVADVADVRIGALTRYGAVSRGGTGETVQGLVLGLRGANARQVVDEVRARLASLEALLPTGMRIDVFYDRGALVERAAGTVLRALGEATVLVIAVLWLFLGGWRPAVVVAVCLPVTLLATVCLMSAAGLGANLMSLGGLAVALGMLVDAAVVVVEGIDAHSDAASGAAPPGFSGVVRDAVTSVGAPVAAGVVIIALVFVPLLTLQGLEGKLFAPVALAIVFALAASIVVAFTFVPVVAAWLLRPSGAHGSALMGWVVKGFRRLLGGAFARPWRVYGAVFAAMLVALALYPRIGKIFMPTLDEGDLIVQLQKVPAIALSASVEIDGAVQRALLAEVPEIRTIVARTGSDDLGLDPMGFNETDSFLVLRPPSAWRGTKDDVEAAVRTVMERFPGVIHSFTQPIEMRTAEMLTGTRGDVAIKVFGPDVERLSQATRAIAARLRDVRGAAEVIAPRNEGVQYLSMRIDRLAAGRAGLTAEAIQSALRGQLEGQTLGIVQEGAVRTPIVIRGTDTWRESPQAIGQWRVRGAGGVDWPLAMLGQFVLTDGPVRIDHEDGSRFAVVQVNVDGRDLAGFVDEARQAVAPLPALAGLRVVWGGQFENQQRAAARLGLVVPLALAAVFVVLVLVFGSAAQAALVMLNVPFALVGGVVALWASGQYLSVPASVGFIALLGIAVLNGVVLVAHFNERLAAGEPLPTVVREGTVRRLRPVLMTAAITALGMAPLLVATGPGSEIQRPLAIVVSGGLLTSTPLTLLLLPVLFERFGRFWPARGVR